MSDELLSPSGSNEPVSPEQTITDPAIISKLREEIKGLKQTKRELEDFRKSAEPVLTEYQQLQEARKTDAQKAVERAQEAEAKLNAANAAVLTAQREAKLVRLATKAGVDPDVAALLDLSKLDLEDEEASMKVLGKLATARTTANGASNPARNGATGMTDKELRDTYFNGGGPRSKTMIFGGN